jgi:LmbE family N-acetylglucosaminyl deacetylase
MTGHTLLGVWAHPDDEAYLSAGLMLQHVERTTDAWTTTGTDSDLWYATVTPDFHARWGHVNDRIGLWSDQPEPPSTTPHELCHQIVLSETQLGMKQRALAAHCSQTAVLVEAVGHRAYRSWWGIETFRAAPSSATIDQTCYVVEVGAS